MPLLKIKNRSELLPIREGHPSLTSYEPIAADRFRYHGSMTEINVFAIYDCVSSALRWDIRPKNLAETCDELRNSLLLKNPNLRICACGCLTSDILSFEQCDDGLSESEVKEIVVRTFAARQMDLYYQFEDAHIQIKGIPLHLTIGNLLKYYGYEIPRLH
jgi:hypothetical protein